MKIGIVLCGNSGGDYYTFDYPIKIIHSFLHLNEELYEDFVDITADEFYNRISADPNIDVKTSQAPTGYILETYEQMKAEGFTHVLVITISSQLSGTYQGAVLAADMIEDLEVRVVDSKSVSYGQVYLTLEAIKQIKEGKQLEEIATNLESLTQNINILVYVDTLKFLVKNGRLSAASGAIGTLLKIKPILRLTQEDGKLIPHEKIRTSRKALKRILEIFEKEAKGREVESFLAYTNNLDFAKEVRRQILNIRPDIKVELVPLTPVVGAHAGPGTLGFGYIFKWMIKEK